ncbi:MAG: hypothetical protein KA314_00470 [Chloroflexi bacterium]|nr:hypothetical protein [Chloroflexota bacterium]MBP8054279.1 hypothetical protein [Chloroflexota bacterium]
MKARKEGTEAGKGWCVGQTIPEGMIAGIEPAFLAEYQITHTIRPACCA